MEGFKWCFIGCGKLAGIVAEQITASGRHEIVSAYARRPEAVKDFTDRFGGRPCLSAQEALETEGVDGVYIVTTHRSHFEYAKLALEKGIPVLLEKPFTVNAADTDTLIGIARSRNLYLAEAMWTWFSPVANKVKEWISQGRAGRIEEAVADVRSYSLGYAPRVSDPAVGGGAILDMGVYGITYIYRLFGYPLKIDAKAVIADGIDYKDEVVFDYGDGMSCKVLTSIDDKEIIPSLHIKGSEGSVFVDELHYAHRAVLKTAEGEEVFEGDGSYLNEFDRVAEEIRAGLTESRLVPLKATSDVMKLIDEVRRQTGLRYPFEM